jgi:hypothetical protein
MKDLVERPTPQEAEIAGVAVQDVLAARSTDAEVSAILDELSRLQTWCIMQAHRDPLAVSAADLVQRTRILVIERCSKAPLQRAQGER